MLKNLESLADVAEFEKVPFEQRNVPKTSYEIFEQSASEFGNKIALEFFADGNSFKRSTKFSYLDLFHNINCYANMFRAHGVEREDVVAFVLPNLPETHYVIWGGEAAGIVMSLNPLLEAPQLANLLSAAKAKFLVCLAPTPGADIWQKCVVASKTVNTLKGIFTVNATKYLGLAKKVGATLISSLDGAKNEATDIPVFALEKECVKYPTEELTFNPPIATDIASYFCTGGTTGLPKVAKRSHFSETFNAWSITQVFQSVFTKELTIFCGLPLFHVNGQIVTGLAPWGKGAKVVLGTPQGYRAKNLIENFWKIVQHYQINLFSGVPTLYASLMSIPLDNANINSLNSAICGAAPLPKELFKQFTQKTRIPLIEGYGLTEGACASSLNPGKSSDTVGSIGFRIPYQEMKAVILDSDGKYLRDANVDEVGSIAIKGPNVFSGYLEDEHNENIWIDCEDELWLNTGDLGRQDLEGMFWLTGRKKELIIRGGHNIDPSIIEEALHSHENVKLAAAVPRPDAYAGELPVAYVEFQPGTHVDIDELQKYAESRISEKAAWPKKITALDTLPVTPVGKLHKPSLIHLEIKNVIREVCGQVGVELQTIVVKQDKKLGVVSEIKLHGNPDKVEGLLKEVEKYALNVSLAE